MNLSRLNLERLDCGPLGAYFAPWNLTPPANRGFPDNDPGSSSTLAGSSPLSHEKRLPLVYVAGPYTNPDPVENTRNAITAGMRLYDSGKGVPIIPHLSLLAHIVDPRGIDYWYALDLAQLDHCTALWRIPGASSGADKEVAHAEGRGIPVFYEWDALMEALA